MFESSAARQPLSGQDFGMVQGSGMVRRTWPRWGASLQADICTAFPAPNVTGAPTLQALRR